MSRFHVRFRHVTGNSSCDGISMGTHFARQEGECEKHVVYLNTDVAGSGCGTLECAKGKETSKNRLDGVITPADMVYTYYNGFRDKAEEMHKYLGGMNLPYNGLLSIEREHIEYCLEEHLSFAKCERIFHLMRNGTRGWESGNFDSSSAFASYVQQRRQELVAEQNWKTAVIDICGKENRSGAFRDIIDVLQDVLKESGPDAILPHEKVLHAGKRQYSQPMNSDASLALAESHGFGMKKVFFSLYCDGTTVTRSGSQTKNIVRVRFYNIRGQRDKWHEIGICPTFRSRDVKNRTSLAKIRAELFHRYLFLVLKSSMEKCKEGFEVAGTLVSPQLLMILADQPQERSLLGLKNVGSFRDCSLCIADRESNDATVRTAQFRETVDCAFDTGTSDDEYSFIACTDASNHGKTWEAKEKRDAEKSLLACIAGGNETTEDTATFRDMTNQGSQA